MIAASCSDDNRYKWSRVRLQFKRKPDNNPFGFDLGPSGPNNNSKLNFVSHLQIPICCF